MPSSARFGLRAALSALAVAGVLALSPAPARADCPLVEAAGKGDADAVQAAIAARADVDCKDERGVTPLWEAADRGRPEVIRLLAAAGADLNAPDARGATPLLATVQADRPDAFTTLVALGADLNATDRKGWTALMHAVYKKRMEMVHTLLQHQGVDLRHTAPDGATAYKIATATHQHHMIFALRNAGVREGK